MKQLLLVALAALAMLAGCNEPPPVVGQRYRVLNTYTEPPREWRTANYDCVRWDKNGWCTEEAFSGWTYHYDDPDYVVQIQQCWPKPGKPVWDHGRVVRVIPSDEQKCITRDLYVVEHEFVGVIPGKTYVVSSLDSIYDGDVRT